LPIAEIFQIQDISETEYRISILLDVADAQDDEQAGPRTFHLLLFLAPNQHEIKIL